MTGFLALSALSALPAAAESGTITGTVTALDTGQPLADVCAEVLTADDHFFTAWGCTDESGAYSVSVPPGTYVILFVDENGDYASSFYGGPTPDDAVVIVVSEGEMHTGIDAVLAPAVAITASVTAADTGEPLGDACLSAYTAASFTWTASGCSDSGGIATIRGLTDGVDYLVDVQPPDGYLGQWLFNAGFDDATAITAPAAVDVTLQRGARVHGLVTDLWGDPVDDVRVRLFDADEFEFIDSDFTDEDGTWSVVIPPSDFKVEFRSDFGIQWAIGRTSFDTATVFATDSEDAVYIEDVLAARPDEELGNVSGMVTDVRTGLPLEGICATASPTDDPWGDGGHACTDETGTYVMDVPAGVYKFAFSDPTGDYAGTYFGGTTFDEAAAVGVPAESEVTGIDVAMAAAAVIEGRMLDLATREPLADVCVNAFAADEPEFIPGQVGGCSDEDGYWRIGGLPQGSVKIHTHGTETYAAQWFDRAASHEDARVLRTRSGHTTRVPNFRLEQGAIVTGTVTDEAGQPIADACVQVSYVPNSRIGGCEWGSMTDADGRYTIHNVPPGDQVFGAGELWGREYASVWNGGASHRSAAEPIAIRSGEAAVVDFVLPPTATISGEVHIAEGYVSLNVYTVDGDLIGTGADLMDGEPFWPGPDGGFQIAGLPTTSVLLEVSWSDTEEWALIDRWWYEAGDSFEDATPIPVVSGEDTKIIITSR